MTINGSPDTGQVLAVTVRFVTDSYDATIGGNPEWPPHPHRLFAAFVAAAGTDRSAADHDALVWLEGLPPPVIDAPTVVTNSLQTEIGPVQFVPTAGVAYNAIRTGLSDGFTPSSKAAASQDPPGTKPTALKAYGAKIDPRVYLHGDICRFWWRLDHIDPDIESRCAVLRRLGRRIPYLGRASTVVTVVSEITEVPALTEHQQRWESRRGPVQVRITLPGLLERLDVIHDDASRGHNRKGKPGPSPRWVHTVPYSCDPEPPEVSSGPGDKTRDDLLVLRFVDGPQPTIRASRLAQTVAALVGSDDVDVVCLPHVGHRYATGELYGILVSGDPKTLRVVHRLTTNGVADTGIEVAPVNQTINTTRVLDAKRWTQPSSTWVTVLPWTPRKKCKTPQAAADRVRHDLVEAGFPEPVSVTCQQGPYLAGSAHCGAYHLPSAFHVAVVFPEPVPGPVRVGTRNLGLFLPVQHDNGGVTRG